MLGKNFINILSDQKLAKYNYGFITEEFLKSVINDFNKIFYLCGATADDGCNRKAVSQFAGE